MEVQSGKFKVLFNPFLMDTIDLVLFILFQDFVNLLGLFLYINSFIIPCFNIIRFKEDILTYINNQKKMVIKIFIYFILLISYYI